MKSYRPLRDLLVFVLGIVIASVGFYESTTLLLFGVAMIGTPFVTHSVPVLRPDPPNPEGRQAGCACRGCTRPGQRTLVERLRRKPLSSVPRSHAQAILGVEHGRIHDARRMECAAGMEHSTEVISHFALPPEQWTEAEFDDMWADFDSHERGGCRESPGMVSLSWR